MYSKFLSNQDFLSWNYWQLDINYNYTVYCFQKLSTVLVLNTVVLLLRPGNLCLCESEKNTQPKTC